MTNTMPRKTTPSFITELPLIVTSQDEKELKARFNAGMRLLNACLNEANIRMKLVRNSEAFKQALKLTKIVQGKDRNPVANPERIKAFAQARAAARFTEYELHSFATVVANESKWIAEKLDANTQREFGGESTLSPDTRQKLATRAFNAVEKVLLGKAKSFRYKVHSRFRSMEGKTNKQGLRWKDECLVWGQLKLKPLIERNDPVILHGLNHRVKYVRLIRKELGGGTRWYIQLINEGTPYQKPKNPVGDELVGIDLNISNLAVVGDTHAELMPFACGVPTYQKEIAALQRQMQRSQRMNNPDNYELDFLARVGRKIIKKKGKSKKGNKGLKRGDKRLWNHSRRYKQLKKRKRNLERRKTAYAKSQNRQLVNIVLKIGKFIKAENVCVKGWQKRYGKAIGAKSPGFVQSELKRKAEKADGKFETFSTTKTALSQTHLDGSRQKKSLSQRIHYDVTGIVMHRDLFSAYLARYVQEDQLDADTARERYAGLEPILVGAFQRYESKSASTAASPRSGVKPLEQIPRKDELLCQIAGFPCGSLGEKLKLKSSVSPFLEEPPGF